MLRTTTQHDIMAQEHEGCPFGIQTRLLYQLVEGASMVQSEAAPLDFDKITHQHKKC